MGKIVKLSNLKKTLNYIRRNGIKAAFSAVRERVHTEVSDDYRYEPLNDFALREQVEAGKQLTVSFSILVPAYETDEEYLRAMVESVLNQTYGNFELIIADASGTDRVQNIINTYLSRDQRIVYKRLKENAGISANTNEALYYASGDYIGLLDHDDLLTPDALYEMACCITEQKKNGIQLQLLYSDEDKCNCEGTAFYKVNKKKEFNLDLILTNNYICHFCVIQRQLMQRTGFRSACDGAQDYDMILHCVNQMMEADTENKGDLPIAHIPRVLYHWRCHEQSTAENPDSKQYAYDAGKKAVEDFLRMRHWKGVVSHTGHLGYYHTEYQPDIFANRPNVAVVGGKLLDRRRRIAGGIYEADGTPLYLGLPKSFSGYMNRAVLTQGAEAVDIRCMLCSKEAAAIFEEVMHLPYICNPENGRFDWKKILNEKTKITEKTKISESADIMKMNLKFCKAIRERGYQIVWEPSIIEKLHR